VTRCNKVATNAPAKVPSECARNGKIKCLGSNKCMDSINLSVVVLSLPAGGGMIDPLSVMIPIFKVLPIPAPTRIARIFFRIGCIGDCFFGLKAKSFSVSKIE
jgi:hypothetical protein